MLVTHQVHLLTEVDRVIIIENGIIQANGTLAELSASGIDINKYSRVEAEHLFVLYKIRRNCYVFNLDTDHN